MTSFIHVPGKQIAKTRFDEKNIFKQDVQVGLQKTKKYIHSKYFYDEPGCELFNQITRHPDYYLTRCELEILQANKQALSRLMGKEAFNLIELGPGEGIKTEILINQFLQDALIFRYTPIDISEKYLKFLMQQFENTLPHSQLTPIHADYFKGLEWQSEHSERRNFVLFLGSSIGNFDPLLTNDFLLHLHDSLHDGDYILLGFDLRKDIQLLMQAYNDNAGITRDFNLNILRRINRELAADFDVSKFRHYPTYNVYSGAMESYLISQEQQTVYVGALNQSFEFAAIEPIHVEYSYKYHLPHIEALAAQNGFAIVQHFMDKQHYFVDSLWQVYK